MKTVNSPSLIANRNKLPRVKNPRFSPILSFGSSSKIERPRKYVSPSLHPPPNIQLEKKKKWEVEKTSRLIIGRMGYDIPRATEIIPPANRGDSANTLELDI